MCLGEPESVFLIFREKCADFLFPIASFELAVLGLLVVSLRNWRRRCATNGSGFEFSGAINVQEKWMIYIHISLLWRRKI